MTQLSLAAAVQLLCFGDFSVIFLDFSVIFWTSSDVQGGDEQGGGVKGGGVQGGGVQGDGVQGGDEDDLTFPCC